jgi:hypothetical protein
LVSALIVIPLAYVAGHLLQTLAADALPSAVKQPDGTSRYPSDLLLDKANNTFSNTFKAELAQQVRDSFGIDVGIDTPSCADISRARADAFFLCRSTLISAKAVSYGEQFEGMYALMRGLALAFGLGSVSHLGWGFAGLRSDGLCSIARAALCVGLIGAIGSTLAEGRRASLARWTLGFVGMVVFCLAYLSGYGKVTGESALRLVGIAIASFFMAVRCWRAYRSFAEHFAKAIYRDYFAQHKEPRGGKESVETDLEGTQSEGG